MKKKMLYINIGTSDPYVKFKLGSKVIYRSKTVYRDLNPIWEEDFDVHLDDLNTPLHIRVMIIRTVFEKDRSHCFLNFVSYLGYSRCLITIGECRTIFWDQLL